jgi:hypothetical protein
MNQKSNSNSKNEVLKKIKRIMPQRLKSYLQYCFPEKRRLIYRKKAEQSNYKLAVFSELAREKVLTSAERIYGKDSSNSALAPGWNYYSDALGGEVVQAFESSVLALTPVFQSVNYLEIGSAQGMSMSVIALMLEAQGILGELVSVDPYFDDGYKEGLGGDYHVNINKNTKKRAFELYQSLSIDVELLEMNSSDGLKSLIQAGRKFHLIYIDGSHLGLNPVIDFGLSCTLLHLDGVMMLDDHYWPDVAGLKSLCDKHCVKIHECWKVAAYKLPQSSPSCG